MLVVLWVCMPIAAIADLNVSIAVFDPGIPDDRSSRRDLQVYPKIREIEALLMPFVLREALVATGGWGAVRVIPEPDAAAELLVTAEIRHSDGDTVQLAVRARDARGELWVDEVFSDSIVAGDERLFAMIAASIAKARDERDARTLAAIEELSVLLYANRLAPSVFREYFERDANGSVTLLRLPARDDPMLQRIHLLRETEYVITDAVDEKFRQLHEEIASVYAVWREYRRRTEEYQATNAELAENRTAAPAGSYEALQDLYDNYKWHRLATQEQDRLVVAFDNEVRETIGAMDSRIYELEGFIGDKYDIWNRILEDFHELESQP